MSTAGTSGFDRDAIVDRFARTGRAFPRAHIAACLDDPELGREVVRESLRRAIATGATDDESPVFLAWPIAGALADPKLLDDVVAFLELDDESLDLLLGDLLSEISDRVVHAIGRSTPDKLRTALSNSVDRPCAARTYAEALVRCVVVDGYSAERVRDALVDVLDRWSASGFPEEANEIDHWFTALALGKLGFVEDHARIRALQTKFTHIDRDEPFVAVPDGMTAEAYRAHAQGLAREAFASESPLDPFMLESWPVFRDEKSPNAVMNEAIHFAKKTAKNRARAKDARKQKKKARRKR